MVGFIVFLGFIKPIVKPIEIISLENRPANMMPQFNAKDIFNNKYQNTFENALSDQIPFSSYMKVGVKSINLATKIAYTSLFNNENIMIDNFVLSSGYLLNDAVSLDYYLDSLNKRAENINNAMKQNPKIDFYLYYIEKDTDINFYQNQKVGAYEYLISKIDNKIHKDKFAIDNFDDFKKYFYKTDHHWNYQGSYKGYQDVANLLGVSKIVKPINTFCVKKTWCGSKGRTIGSQYVKREKFCAYEFDFPSHETYINNNLVDAYGNYKDYLSGKLKSVSYGDYYGFDVGLLEFDYNNPNKENLLIIGESFDNAINELLSTHFNKTYNIDLRAYETNLGEPFNLSQIIKKYDIDKVLLIGNIGFFVDNTFDLK